MASIFTFNVDMSSLLATCSHIETFSHLRVPHTTILSELINVPMSKLNYAKSVIVELHIVTSGSEKKLLMCVFIKEDEEITDVCLYKRR